MAEGLRLVGACPRCGGTLEFAAGEPAAPEQPATPEAGGEVAPHLVLGIPRR
jgi:hypothetical protein